MDAFWDHQARMLISAQPRTSWIPRCASGRRRGRNPRADRRQLCRSRRAGRGTHSGRQPNTLASAPGHCRSGQWPARRAFPTGRRTSACRTALRNEHAAAGARPHRLSRNARGDRLRSRKGRVLSAGRFERPDQSVICEHQVTPADFEIEPAGGAGGGRQNLGCVPPPRPSRFELNVQSDYVFL